MQIRKQVGLSLTGFIFVLVIVGLLAVLAMQIVPSVMEYTAIKKAVSRAAQTGTTPQEIRESFDRQRTTAYIDSVTARDLEIVKTENGHEVSVSYQKWIPLVGPASLVLDYEASSSSR